MTMNQSASLAHSKPSRVISFYDSTNASHPHTAPYCRHNVLSRLHPSLPTTARPPFTLHIEGGDGAHQGPLQPFRISHRQLPKSSR